MQGFFRIPELSNIVLQKFRILPPSDEETRGIPCDHVSRDDLVSEREKRQVLYRMALVNRTMSELALPLLWSTIEGISPLLSLVPALEYNEVVEEWVSRSSPWQY